MRTILISDDKAFDIMTKLLPTPSSTPQRRIQPIIQPHSDCQNSLVSRSDLLDTVWSARPIVLRLTKDKVFRSSPGWQKAAPAQQRGARRIEE